MTEQIVSDALGGLDRSSEKGRELPVGSELLIAFALGAGGWYALVRLISWIAG